MCTLTDADAWTELSAGVEELADVLDPATFGARVGRLVRQTLPSLDVVMIALARDDRAGGLVVPGTSPTDLGDGLGMRTLHQGSAAFVRDLQPLLNTELLSDAERTLLGSSEVRTVVCVPVVHDGEPVGVLLVGAHEAGAIGAATFGALGLFGDLLAPTLSRLREIESLMQRAREAERQRIAQHLHDTTSALMFDIRLTARCLRREQVDPRLATGWAKRIEDDAAEVGRQLRSTMGELRSEEGLLTMVCRQVESFGRRTGRGAEVVCVGRPVGIGGHVGRIIPVMLREVLRNVEKHAGPSAAVVVTVDYARTGWFSLVVDDDGTGPLGRPAVAPDRLHGFGLSGIAERVDEVGGALRTSVNDDGGFRVMLEVPVSRPSETGVRVVG